MNRKNSEDLALRMDKSSDELALLLEEARMDERKKCAFDVSLLLEALAGYITRRQMNSTQAAELLCQQAARHEAEAQEMH